MKNILIVLLLTILFGCRNSGKVIYKYYSNGKVDTMFIPKPDSFKDTDVCIYFQNGKLEYKYMKRNGFIKDTEYAYYNNGELEERAMFDSSMYNGKIYGYYRSGALKVIGFFKNNLKSGTWEYFDSIHRGRVKSIVEYIIINKKSESNRRIFFKYDSSNVYTAGVYFTVMPKITSVINSDTVYTFFISHPVSFGENIGNTRVIYGKLGENFSDFSKVDTIYPNTESGTFLIPNINNKEIYEMKGILQFYKNVYSPKKKDTLVEVANFYFNLNKHTDEW